MPSPARGWVGDGFEEGLLDKLALTLCPCPGAHSFLPLMLLRSSNALPLTVHLQNTLPPTADTGWTQ